MYRFPLSNILSPSKSLYVVLEKRGHDVRVSICGTLKKKTEKREKKKKEKRKKNGGQTPFAIRRINAGDDNFAGKRKYIVSGVRKRDTK